MQKSLSRSSFRLRTKQIRQRFRFLKEGSLTFEMLRYAAAGTLVLGAMGILATAPGLAIAGKLFLSSSQKNKRSHHRAELKQAMERLAKRRLVKLVAHQNGTAIHITESGQEAIFFSARERMRPEKVKRWDGKWRVVLFDIPEDQRSARDALRRMLTNIGFFPLQKSAFAIPYPCRKEVAAIADFFSVEYFVVYLETDDLGSRERNAQIYFGL